LRNEHLAFIATNPLFHFALMQSELSFPMLANYAYKPDKLNEQLEAQARVVINHPNLKVLIRHKLISINGSLTNHLLPSVLPFKHF